jgi:hypothetical protein
MTDQPRAEAILRRKARRPGHGPVRRIDPATGARSRAPAAPSAAWRGDGARVATS